MNLMSWNTAHSSNKLGSIDGYKKYGILSSQLHSSLVNDFSIPAKFKAGLEQYYILHWGFKYFLAKLQDGIIEHQDQSYIVIYRGISLGEVKNAAQGIGTKGERTLLVSFRRAKQEYSLPNYVIVTRKFQNEQA